MTATFEPTVKSGKKGCYRRASRVPLNSGSDLDRVPRDDPYWIDWIRRTPFPYRSPFLPLWSVSKVLRMGRTVTRS